MYSKDNFESKPKKNNEFILNLIFENIELTGRNIRLAYEVRKLKKQLLEIKR